MEEDNQKAFSVFVGTWNVNGQSPTCTGGLKDWLAVDEEAPDLCVLGFQELDLSWWAYLLQESHKEEEWVKAVEESLHPDGCYLLVKKVKLVGMMLLVYSKEEHVESIQDVSADSVGTGIQGMLHRLGNKGAVAIRLRLHETELCFVNSHLAAGEGEVQRRNQDYQDIVRSISFLLGSKDNENIIWLGDLNYRLSLECNDIKDFLAEDNLAKLQEADELHRQMELGKVFKDYQEGPISFKPTYKYDPGSSSWDTSKKSRSPAWTDRILWKGRRVAQSAYRSHQAVMTSDHKPVSASFLILVQVGKEIVEDVNNNNEDTLEHVDIVQTAFAPVPQKLVFGACLCLLFAYYHYSYHHM